MSDAGSNPSKYYFNNTGIVRDLIFPNKAILVFRLNGKEEKAILLSKMLTLDGKETDVKQSLDIYLKMGDAVQFDCHIYDKGGGVGSGKDRYVVKRYHRHSLVIYCTNSVNGGEMKRSERCCDVFRVLGPVPFPTELHFIRVM